ncbi:MAG: AsmA-like C-terminal region-containing protein [Cyclobacteriaceae bacterium]|nr:AsmA-like C-terminal region-containing protein [Cyclobacteriaceae bacterium]
MKVFKKTLLYLLLLLLTALFALILSAFLFSDQLINEFIRKANTRLNTRITIGKTKVDVFSHFPSLALDFNNVYIEDTHAGQYPLLTAGRIAFTLNPIKVLRGDYTVNGIIITESEINLKINAKGEENYQLLKESADASYSSLGFNLTGIRLYNCRVHYLNLELNDDLVFYTDRLNVSLQAAKDQYTILAGGQVNVEKFHTGPTVWPTPRAFDVQASMIYDDTDKKLVIQPSDLKMHQALFGIQGVYQWKDENALQLAVTGKNTNVQTLIAFLPETYQQAFTRYRSQGDVYFNLNLKGTFGKTTSPALEAQFGLQKARIYHPDFNTSLDDVSLDGRIQIRNLRKPESGQISLKNITGQLNNKLFTGSLTLKNFSDPEVILEFQGEADVGSVLKFYPIKNLSQATGNIKANISFEGKTSWLKNKSTAQKVSALGSIEMNNLSLHFIKPEMVLNRLSGTLQFNRNDLALSNVSGTLGESDFRLNGFFKNVITFLLFENQPLGIEADLQARYINLAQLFEYAFASSEAEDKKAFEFAISPLVNLKFMADIQALRFNRFYARKLKGDLTVTGQTALSRNISFSGLGGDVLLTGSLNAKNPKVIEASGGLLLDGVHLDSAFYVFNNFGQTFIQNHHLKGRAFAEIMMEMKLKPDLTLFPETLVADISATIKDGQLNNFEPLQKLSKYVADNSLHALRFADLKNDIHIERSTVFIPMMEVVSNATVLQISGTHRFDQQIDYRIVTPLQNRAINLEEASGAIEEMDGRAKLFLKITGTTDNYRVVYDTDAVKRKIASDLKREVQELKDLFKKRQKKKEAELSKEEFDWEN